MASDANTNDKGAMIFNNLPRKGRCNLGPILRNEITVVGPVR